MNVAWLRSLRGRLFAGILATVLVAVAISLAIGITLTRGAVRDSNADQLSREADLFSGAAATSGRPALGIQFLEALPPGAPPGPIAEAIPFERPIPGAGEPNSGAVPAAPPGGDVFAAGGDSRPAPRVISLDEASQVLPESAIDSLEDGGEADGQVEIGGEDRLFAARAIETAATESSAGGAAEAQEMIFLLTRSASVAGEDFQPYLGGLLLASGLAGLLAALAAALLARRLSAPIQRVSAASRELADGRRPEPLAEDGPEELATLARSFNEMTAQLERAREAERSVLLSVSHELRTPLTAIRGYAEAVEDKTVGAGVGARVIAAEAGRLERLVQDLLALARLEQGVLGFRREPFELGGIAEAARSRLALTAAEDGVEVVVEGPGGSALADPDRALQVVSNLIENAVRVSPRGATVRVEVAPASVTVADSGPGIAAEDIPHAFDRFHLRDRGGAANGDGSGIGLAIVRELTEGMGGTVELASEVGVGAAFTVRLPSEPGASRTPAA